MILQFSDGTTTVSCAGSVGYVSEPYHPTPPEMQGIQVGGARDGGSIAALYRRNVHEEIHVKLLGTASAIRTWINNLERLLDQAASHVVDKVSQAVYLYYDPVETNPADAWRSEVLFGSVHIEAGGVRNWSGGAVDVVVSFGRRFYWEGAESQLTLTNGHGSGSYGKIVYNTNDATYDNWVQISGAAIGGVLPTPFRLEFTNTYATGRTDMVRTALAVWGGLDPAYAVLETENAAYVAGSPSATAGSTYSGGYYKAATWTGDVETQVYRWQLTTAMLDTYKGRHFRLIVRFATPPATSAYWVRPKVTFPTGSPLTPVYEGELVQLNTSHTLQDLGDVQLPPWLSTQSSLAAVDLTLYARAAGGGTLAMDCVHLLPSEGYRELTPAGYGIDQNITLTDDQLERVVYTAGWSSTGKTGHYYPRGADQYLIPGKNATLYFLARSTTGGAEIARQGQVKVYYRPRRATV